MQRKRSFALPIGLFFTVVLLFVEIGLAQTRSKPRNQLPNAAQPTNTLSRKKAQELITKAMNLPATQTDVLGSYFKRSWSDPASGPFGISAACLVSGGARTYQDVEKILVDLQSKGLISIGERKDHQGECNYLYATTSLTEAGKKYLVKELNGAVQVKTCDAIFGEVTGIQVFEQTKTAVADYTLKVINITPFATNVPAGPISRHATFALYDDGWRVKSW
jgi:hypothetical protein